MPAAHENLAPYLLVGHPEENVSDSAAGNIYAYRGPTTTINANKPNPGETWADGRPVVSRRAFAFNDASATSELVVVTQVNTTYSGTIGTAALEQVSYGLRWRPVAKPLEVHPEFQAGGSYDLSVAEGSGDNAHSGYQDVMGWRAETDPKLRDNYQYKRLSSDGISGLTITLTAAAQVFVDMLFIGVDEFVDYLPIWRKRSIYKGSNPPTAGSIGQAGVPSGPVPSDITGDYYFVKSADDVERIGQTSRWRRDEEWEGGTAVYLDRDEIFPDGAPY